MAVTEGEGRLSLDLLTAAAAPLGSGASEAVLDVDLCHLEVDSCLSNRTVLDLSMLQDLGLSGTCVSTAPDGNASDLFVCQIANNGLLPVHLTWRTTVDGVDDGWTITVQPGAERALWESNPAFTRWNEADRATVAWGVSWSLTASHEVGPTTVLQEGTYSVEASDDGTTPTDDGSGTQGDAAEGRGAGTWIGLGVLLLVAAAGATAMVLRRPALSEDKVSSWTEPQLPEATVPEAHAPNEPASGDDPEAVAYHDGLLEQGYGPEDALAYTRQYFPDFRS